jgi:hypothetical protein
MNIEDLIDNEYCHILRDNKLIKARIIFAIFRRHRDNETTDVHLVSNKPKRTYNVDIKKCIIDKEEIKNIKKIININKIIKQHEKDNSNNNILST